MNELTALQTARWIWCDHSQTENQYACFLQDFTAKADATLYIAADMNYAAFVNGQYVPGFAWSDYPEQRSVDVLDITPYLRNGNNRLCVMAYCQVVSSHTYRAGKPCLRFAVMAGETPLAVSGENTLSRRAPDYEQGEMEWISPQIAHTFHYNAQLADNWLSPSYTPNSAWHPSVEVADGPALRTRPLSQLELGQPCETKVLTYGVFNDPPASADKTPGYRMQYASLGFRGMVATNDGPLTLPRAEGISLSACGGDGLYTVIDCGEMTTGLFTMDVELPADCDVFIGFGEHLDDLRVRTLVSNCEFSAVYRGKAGRQQFTHYFKRLGCRYLQLFIYAPNVTLHYVGLRPVMYPVQVLPAPQTADRLTRAIYAMAVRTLRLCMHEHYEDCPSREQSMYAMDSRVQMLCGYYAFGETAMPRESIRLMAEGQREDGFFEMCAPSTFELTIPSFSLALLGALYDYVQHSGDLDFAAEQLGRFGRCLQAFLPQMTDSGLLSDFTTAEHWNFYEWNDGLNGRMGNSGRSLEGRYAPLQAMFVMAAEQYLTLCDKTGVAPFTPELPAIVARIRKASQAFWDESKQVFCTCLDAQQPDCELVQALMVCAGITDDRQRKILLDKLANPDENGLVPVTLSYSLFKYDALMTQPDRYAAFVKEDIARIWGGLLFKGATAFWETQRGAWDFEGIGSLCHGWSAVPVYLYRCYAEHLL